MDYDNTKSNQSKIFFEVKKNLLNIAEHYEKFKNCTPPQLPNSWFSTLWKIFLCVFRMQNTRRKISDTRFFPKVPKLEKPKSVNNDETNLSSWFAFKS